MDEKTRMTQEIMEAAKKKGDLPDRKKTEEFVESFMALLDDTEE